MEPDLARIAATLAEVGRSLENVVGEQRAIANTPSRQVCSDDAGKGENPDRLTVARAWTHAIARRDAVFGNALFFDPAWNMLLELYIVQCQRRHLCVSALCIASKAAPTTALRWIETLEKENLVKRAEDPFDRRRSFIVLTDNGAQKIEAALDKATESDRKLGLGRMVLIQ